MSDLREPQSRRLSDEWSRFSLLRPLNSLSVSKVTRNFLNERYFINRFSDVSDAAGSKGTFPISHHSIRGYGHYRNINRFRLRFYLLGRLKSNHTGKLNIHHNKIRSLDLQYVERFLRGGCLAHLVAMRPKQKHRQTPIHRIVFNQQDLFPS